MSNEITLYASLRGLKNSRLAEAVIEALKVDWTGDSFIHHIQSVAITEEALTLGDIATGGWFFAINRDSTNFVELRSGTGTVNVVKLKAGEFCLFRMSDDATSPFVIADTAAVELEYWLLED